MGFFNQSQPNRLGNTLLFGVCPESKDKYPDVASILAPHVAQLRQLALRGVVVGPHRRAVRLFINGAYPAMCHTVGHKGHSASLPCPLCLGTKCSRHAQSLLNEGFGTVQDLDCAHPSRTADHLGEMQNAYEGMEETPEELGTATHLSIERSPIIVVPSSQIVPLTLHETIGLTLRMLRLGIEAVTRVGGPTAGRQFSHTLAATLSVTIGVEPVPYYGGNFIGRHCHTIASRSHCPVEILQSLVPRAWLEAYERTWVLLKGALTTLNRADIVPLAEQHRFKGDARAFVRLIQGTFPWVSISPELHMLFSHSWIFMGLWGSTGLYGEQAIE